MGQALAEGFGGLEGLSVVALVDQHEPRERFGATYAPSLDDVDDTGVDVVVDFSSPEGVVASAAWCERHRVALVVGATGLLDAQRDALVSAAKVVGVIVASNFSIGAVLAERFAAMAAPYFDRVEIVELHHDRKVDAPSGTSIATARAVADARQRAGRAPLADPTTRHSIPGARGADAADGVRIHAVRLPGLVAHQEVLFGSPGEGLTIRHDSFDRQSFVRGVALAVRAVDAASPGLLEGIASLVP
jgi:4-hydroxy-tetrahydrodipicolinate reductase